MLQTHLIKKIETIAEQKINLVFASIAKVLLENIENLEHFNIKQFALAANCSPASFLKFAKYLGYKGTKDLIPALIYEKQTMYHENELTKSQTSGDVMFDFYLNKYAEVLLANLKAANIANRRAILQLTKLLQKNTPIFLVGKGANLDVCNIFSNYLQKMGYVVYFSQDFEIQQKWQELFTHKALCVIFSASGSSRRISNIAKAAVKKRSQIINFTFNANSEIYKAATINFLVQNNEEIFHEQRNVRITFLFLAMQIVLVLAKRANHKKK
ncbi:MurR/RpiR family transcriptional regulator [Candidatus Mycoplasma pogonae]